MMWIDSYRHPVALTLCVVLAGTVMANEFVVDFHTVDSSAQVFGGGFALSGTAGQHDAVLALSGFGEVGRYR